MRLRLLDLFCGAGGAAMGYHRAGWTVVGVDIVHQPGYPFLFIQGDAMEYVAEHGREYDAIHASPPCQRYSWCTPVEHRENHPDMIGAVRDALCSTGRPYVIETVGGGRRLLQSPIMLCGSMFGLNMWRHRWFEAPLIAHVLVPQCNHVAFPKPVLISGSPRRNGMRREEPARVRRTAMGVPWITRIEMDQAIPPAYTEFIGRAMLREVA